MRACQPRAYKRTTLAGPEPVRSPDRIERDFQAPAPGQRLVGDITYLKTDRGWLYLATVIDLATRMVVGWQLAITCVPAWSPTRWPWRSPAAVRTVDTAASRSACSWADGATFERWVRSPAGIRNRRSNPFHLRTTAEANALMQPTRSVLPNTSTEPGRASIVTPVNK